jgi:hypothetical protein
MSDRVTSHFQIGWRLFKARAGVFVVSMTLLFLSGIVVALLVLHPSGFAIGLIILLAWLLVCSGMIVGLHVLALKSVDDRGPRVDDLFGSLALGPTYLGALFVIAFLLNAAGAAILGLGPVISFPVSLLAIAGFYRSLQPATA